MTAFRLLLRLYPGAFRDRYGAEMTEAFSKLLERTRAEKGVLGAALLWARTAGDALVSGSRERIRGAPDRGDGRSGGTVAFHLTQALRTLRRAPRYVATFVVTLGLAIGVNSAVFSVVNSVLLRPLPYQDADRLLYLKQPVQTAGVENARFSFMEIDDYRAAATTVDEFVEFGDWEFTVLGEGEPHRAVGGLVTSNYFDVLGLRPALGRLLNGEDDVRGAEPVMLLTDAYWDRTFGRDPSIVGRVLDLENVNPEAPYTPTRVVGVLEPGLNYTSSRQPDFYVNYATNDHYQDAAMRDARGHRMTDIFARMAPGASVATTRSELQSINQRLQREYPASYDPSMGYGLEAVLWQDELTERSRPTFLVLMGTVVVILLLAAANVTNLTLTRLIRKEDELSTRAALGASRTDLRLHLTAENALLGLAGGVLGIALAYVSRSSLVAYASRFTVRAQEVGVDWTVLGVTLGGATLVATLLAWLPGLPVNPGVQGVASARSRATDNRWRKRVQRGLVVSQLALSFTLLTGASLLVRSMNKLSAVDPGFRTEQVLTVEAPMGPGGTGLPGMAPPDWDSALEEIRAFPGVRSAAIASWAPLSAATPIAASIRVDDEEDAGDRTHLSATNMVSPEYFETLGVPLIAGRLFDDGDRDGSTEVAILNESMARAHFGDADPIGHRISISMDRSAVSGGSSNWLWFEIVGVVADSRDYGVETEGVHTMYRPAAQATGGPVILVAHQGDPGPVADQVRDVLHRMQADRAVGPTRTMASLMAQDVAPSRLNAILFGSFAVLALLIAAVGVLATLGFSVSQRVREFGIRMALGADRNSVLRNVLGEGVLLMGIGLAVGSVGAVVLARFLSGLLFGVEPLDPTSLALAAGTLGAVALVAAYLPALRAVRIQPTDALKGD